MGGAEPNQQGTAFPLGPALFLIDVHGARQVADAGHGGEDAGGVDLLRVKGDAGAVVAVIEACLEHPGAALEHFLHQPDTGGAANAVDQKAQVRSFRIGVGEIGQILRAVSIFVGARGQPHRILAAAVEIIQSRGGQDLEGATAALAAETVLHAADARVDPLGRCQDQAAMGAAPCVRGHIGLLRLRPALEFWP